MSTLNVGRPSRRAAAARPRADAADRRAAGGRPAAAARPARPARRSRSWPRRAMRSSTTSGLLFAIGVAVGFAEDGNGAAGLAGVVCFLVATNGAEALIDRAAGRDCAGLTGKAADLARAAFKADAIVQAQRAARHPLRRHRRRPLQPLRRHHAAGLPGLLRRPALRADRQRPGRAGAGARLRPRLDLRSAAASTGSATASSPPGRSACSPTAC